MVLKVNGTIQLQYKVIELGNDHYISRAVGLGFSDWPEYFFSHFQGQNICFQSIMSQICFSQAILGQTIFFYTIQIWKQLYSYESVTQLLY